MELDKDIILKEVIYDECWGNLEEVESETSVGRGRGKRGALERQLLKECEGQVLVRGIDGLSPAVAPAKLCFSLIA